MSLNCSIDKLDMQLMYWAAYLFRDELKEFIAGLEAAEEVLQ